jgi:Photosynthesis affected mutant 68
MSSKSEENAQKEREAIDRRSLPFEPKSRKTAESKPKSQPIRKATAPSKATSSNATRSADSGIPEVVSRRMMRRMAVFSGVPTALGMLTFVVSYLVVTNDLVALPTYAVLLVSLGWFGLGVLGLTYGVLSASWEEEGSGTRLGIAEFKTNLGRTTAAWRENSENAKAARAEAAADRASQGKANKKS